MTTRVSDVRSQRRPSRGFDVREAVFSIAEARRALPYVARLLHDASLAYRCVQNARQELLCTLNKRELVELIHQRDYAIDRLNAIIDECNAVGLAHIHIPTGRAAFQAVYADRPVTLLWCVGQPVDAAWCELDQPVDPRSIATARTAPIEEVSQSKRSESAEKSVHGSQFTVHGLT